MVQDHSQTGFWDFAFAIVDAIEKGDYVEDLAPDYHDKNKKMGIVYNASQELDNGKNILKLASMLHTAFFEQLSSVQRKDETLYDIGITRYRGHECFIFTLPMATAVDFHKVREEIKFYRSLFMESKSILMEEDLIALGPFEGHDIVAFQNCFESMIDYELAADEGIKGRKIEVSSDLTCFIFPRAAYLRLFQHEEDFNPSFKPDGNNTGSSYNYDTLG
jgi:hypothetical protein